MVLLLPTLFITLKPLFQWRLNALLIQVHILVKKSITAFQQSLLQWSSHKRR